MNPSYFPARSQPRHSAHPGYSTPPRALAAIRETIAANPDAEQVTYLADFIANSPRGIIK
jgi:hypothetical protein